MKKGLICACFFFLLFCQNQCIYAAEYQDLNYDEIQKVVDEVTKKGKSFNFEEYVGKFISGETPFSFKQIVNDGINEVKNQFLNHRNMIVRLLSIAVIAAVFTNFAKVFQSNQVSETGFYVTYLLLFSVLTASFFSATSLAGKTLSLLLNFMKALVPTYFIAVTVSAGAKTSLLFYESTLILISVVNVVLIKILIPVINIYFVLILANNIAKEDMLSKFADFLETVVSWTLKAMMGAVVGFHVIQGMIVPVADYVKNSLLLRGLGAIPGMGNSIGSVTKTVFGAGILVKNAVGVAGLIVILLICAVPMFQLGFYTILYKLGVAVIQPISDKRMLHCISGAAKAVKLLLYTVGIGAALFLFSIAIIASTTNLRLGG